MFNFIKNILEKFGCEIMRIREKIFKSTFALLIFLCVSITPIMLIEEVNATSTGYEYQVLDLVNQERSKVNIAPLQMDQELSGAAQIRSREIDIVFSHTRPDGSPWHTVSSKVNGENLARGSPTPQDVMEGWMNSESHRKNILNPNFKLIGISYYQGQYSCWVQLFAIGEVPVTPNQPIIPIVENNNNNNQNTNVPNTNNQNTNSQNTINQNTNVQNTNNQNTNILNTNSQNTSSQNSKIQNASSQNTSSQNSKIQNSSSQKTSNPNFSNQTSTNSIQSSSTKDKNIIKKPKTPLFSLISADKKIILVWKKVSKANGYEIYRSTKKYGKYVLRKTVSQKNTLKFTDKKLKNKKKYFYIIRSYALNKGKKVYSKFSSIKSKAPKK